MWASKVEAVEEEKLRKYFTDETPLGPLNARLVKDPEVLTLLTETELVAVKAEDRRPSIVVGRRVL